MDSELIWLQYQHLLSSAFRQTQSDVTKQQGICSCRTTRLFKAVHVTSMAFGDTITICGSLFWVYRNELTINEAPPGS